MSERMVHEQHRTTGLPPLSSTLVPAGLWQLQTRSSRLGLGSSNLLFLVGGALIHRVHIILSYFKQQLWCVLDVREIDYCYGILFIKPVFVQDCPRPNAVLLLFFIYCWKALFKKRNSKMRWSVPKYIGGSGPCLHQTPCGSSPTEKTRLLDNSSKGSIQHMIFTFSANWVDQFCFISSAMTHLSCNLR